MPSFDFLNFWTKMSARDNIDMRQKILCLSRVLCLSDPSGTDLHLVFSFFSFSSHLALLLLSPTSTCPRPPNPYIFRKLMIIAIQKLTNCVHQKCWIPNATANVDSVNVCRTHRVPTFPWLFPSPCITSVISLHNLRNSSSDS